MASRYAVGDQVRIISYEALRKHGCLSWPKLLMADSVQTISETNVCDNPRYYNLGDDGAIWHESLLLPLDPGIKDMDSLLNFIGE